MHTKNHSRRSKILLRLFCMFSFFAKLAFHFALLVNRIIALLFYSFFVFSVSHLLSHHIFKNINILKLVDISTSLWYTVEVVISTFCFEEYNFDVG